MIKIEIKRKGDSRIGTGTFREARATQVNTTRRTVKPVLMKAAASRSTPKASLFALLWLLKSYQ